MEIFPLSRFQNLRFQDFKKLAKDNTLSRYEKIGFPDSYRKGKEGFIFKDIRFKLSNLDKKRQLVVDIGSGCSGMSIMLINLCRRNKHRLILIDSKEMLSLLPNYSFITKVEAYYPDDCINLIKEHRNRVDAILAYSLLHYVFLESNVYRFLLFSMQLLSSGGELLIGDIPNASKRKRFFSSESGIHFHQNFTNTKEIPWKEMKASVKGKINDTLIFKLLRKARDFGFESYVVPQPSNLPMFNRREDILIRKL